MFKKILLLMCFILMATPIVHATVSVDSSDALFNKYPVPQPSPKSSLDATNLMTIYNGILNGKYHIKPERVWNSSYLLLQSTADTFECATATDTDVTYMFDGSSWTATNYINSCAKFDIGQIFVSSTSFPAFPGMYEDTRTSITVLGCRAFAEVSSTCDVVQFDFVYSPQTTGGSSVRTWSSLYSSTIPWIGANSNYSCWFTPDVTAIGKNWMVAPRILYVPPSGTIPLIRLEMKYLRKISK